MIKNARVFLSIVLAVGVALAGTVIGGAAPASADTVSDTLSNITYSVDTAAPSAGATVTDYSGDGGRVDILSKVTIGGVEYAVTTIGHDAFSHKDVSAVTIPATVTTIGDFAFSSDSLETVALPSALSSIGRAAFYGNKLTTLAIGNSVTTISQAAFMRNYSLTAVTLGNSVNSIGDEAFSESAITSRLSRIRCGRLDRALLVSQTFLRSIWAKGSSLSVTSPSVAEETPTPLSESPRCRFPTLLPLSEIVPLDSTALIR